MRSSIRDPLFALLVLSALCVAAYLAATSRVPARVPEYALQAEAVYRVEVGTASFSAFYLAVVAFFLALDGRGFAEVGTRGLKVEQVVQLDDRQEESLADQMKLVRNMGEDLEAVEAELGTAVDDLQGLEQRVRKLKEEL
jgi:hypothetical protein